MPVHRYVFLVISSVACLLAASGAFAASYGEGLIWENPHYEHIETYEGTTTCLDCHEDAAEDAFHSIHYQWKADAPDIVNAAGQQLGKINTVNDFCTNPAISWIGILKNDRGKLIGNGCSKCHVGLGLKPAAQVSQEQLENIDCLICHSANYRRQVIKGGDGKLRWQPVALSNPDLMLNIARNVTRPSTEVCMRCHVGSGGGLNFKRGDIETKHAAAERGFDVHMGSGMQCTQCHVFQNHKVAGSGTQLAGSDAPGTEKPACTACHTGSVHEKEKINSHLDAVACTSCHIPTFAKHNPTDMRRDWSKAVYHEKAGKYEPEIEFAKDVEPVYAWWNGKGALALMDQPVKAGGNGRVALYKPQGSISDPRAKIFPFKYHVARLPIDKASNKLIPIKVGMVFKAGKTIPAVKTGAKAAMGKEDVDIGWVDTERYMGVFHEVVPKADALQCNDCHGAKGRMDWKALGYSGDPQDVGGRGG